MGWLQRNPLILALALAAVALAAVLAMELGFTGDSPAPAPGKRVAAAEAKLLPPLASTPPEQAYPEMATRPLFVPTRRPAPDAPVASAQPAFNRGQFTLQGVIVAGDQRVAMLREKASGRIHRVEAGKEVNGIKVVEIQPEVVTLGQGDEREVVPLTVQRAAGGPGVPGVAAAAPPGGPMPAPQSGGPFAQSASPFARAPGAPPAPGAPQPAPPGAVPGTAGTPQAAPVPGAAPAVPPQTAGPGFPMSPEELLARRRARRAQQQAQ